MGKNNGWVIASSLLMLMGLWTVIVDSAGVLDVNDKDSASPCFGANCALSQPHILNHQRRQEQGVAAHHLLPGRHLSPRVRRQMVVVEVDDEDAGSHRLPCTLKEEKEVACLNGKCYALNLAHLRSPFCKCPAKYEGERCELLSAYYFLHYYASVKKGAIIGGVVVVVILIIVAASVYCSYRKGKTRRKERQNKPDIWDTEEAPKVEKTAMMADGESQV